jgi:predicted secreted protein
MPWVSIIAEYFILWWITLFMVLPFGMRTQSEEKSVVNGTVQSAPARFRPLRVFLTTSIVAAVLYVIWYVATVKFGLNAFTFPQIVPDFK